MLGLYSMLECNLCCEILLLLDMADMDCLLCGRLWREQYAECCVLLVGVDRVMYIFRGFCGVHSWQNGTRCRDGGKYCCVIPI